MQEVCPSITNGSTVAHSGTEKRSKVAEILEPVGLVAIRLTVVKEFTDPAVWKSARRNGQRVLDVAPRLNELYVTTHCC